MANILIIDDEDLVHWDLAPVLIEEGHTVTSAYSAQEARGLAAQSKFDAATFDNNMPGGDPGSILIQEFYNAYPLMKRIVISGSMPEEAKARAHACFDKPFEPKQVAAAIGRLLCAEGP